MTVHPIPISALLADGDDSSREELRSFCAQSGWSCDCLSEPGRVLQAATEKHYDVIIAEVPTERFAAEELLWRLRLMNPHQAVLVVTQDGAPWNVLPGLCDAAVEVLPKPISRQLLEDSVTKVLNAVRGRERTATMYKFLASERSIFEFGTAELAKIHPSLVIAERLERSGKIDELVRKRLEVAFQEAITNACDHGNLELESSWRESFEKDGSDRYSAVRAERLAKPEYANRRVLVVTEYTGSRLEIRVRDQGKGFDPSKRKPVEPEPLCSGRGLSLIYRTMDKVWHEQNGREIVMVKTIAPLHQTKER